MTKAKKPRNLERANNLAKALAGIEDGTYSNVNQAAIATRVPPSMIHDCLNSRKSRREANVNRQALTPMEEYALVKWIERAASVGHPIRHSFLREMAEEIRKKRVENEGQIISPLGKEWVTRFLRHNRQLQSRISKTIERARKEVSKEEVLAWFAAFQEAIAKDNVQPENVYNMDETGVHRY